jgi:hypothetical protein
MLAEDLLGKSAAEIIGMFGSNYTEVTPEGDPSYFCYASETPFAFIGSTSAEAINHIQSDIYGCPIIANVCIGNALADLEAVVAQDSRYTYTPADNWYDDLGYTYGWVKVATDSVSYSIYIIEGTIASFSCMLQGG